MNKTNKIKCPRCHSDQLYKFGLDKQANQKYQCKMCKRQFAPNSISEPKVPKYPKCGKATYLHHAYKHYNRYKCGNRNCNHIIIKHHNFNIDNSSSENLTGSLSMKGMHFPLHVTIASWTHKFTPFFKRKADSFKSQLALKSDDWHADETVVFINDLSSIIIL